MIINIMGRDISIEYCSQTRLGLLADDNDAIGFFDGNTIYIKQNVSEAEKSRIFLHEVMHAMLAISGLSNLLEANMEEAVCSLSENYQALIRNLEFIKHA